MSSQHDRFMMSILVEQKISNMIKERDCGQNEINKSELEFQLRNYQDLLIALQKGFTGYYFRAISHFCSEDQLTLSQCKLAEEIIDVFEYVIYNAHDIDALRSRGLNRIRYYGCCDISGINLKINEYIEFLCNRESSSGPTVLRHIMPPAFDIYKTMRNNWHASLSTDRTVEERCLYVVEPLSDHFLSVGEAVPWEPQANA